MSIRLARHSDLAQILEIYAPYITDTAYSFEYTVPTIEEFTQRFDTITAQFPWLVWEEDGQVLGYAYGSAPFERAAYSWCSEASIYLADRAQGRGIGRALYTALEAIMKAQGYRTVYALVASENHRSMAFHKALGYQFRAEFPDCGQKFGSFHSMTWLEKSLDLGGVSGNFPVSWRKVVENDEKLGAILAKIPLF